MKISRKEFLFLSAGAALATAPALASAKKPATPSRTPGDLLIRNVDVLTMDPKLGELTATDVLVRGGRIAEIRPGIRAENCEVIDAKGMILMPGMIDNHRHVWESLEVGGMVKTEPKRFGTYQLYKSQAMVCMTPEDFYLAEYAGGLLALDSGVTTVVDYAHIHYTRDRTVQAVKGLQDSGISGVFCYQLGHNPTHKMGETLSKKRATAERLSPPTEENYRVAEYIRDNLFPSDSLVEFGLATSYGLGVRPMTEMKAEFDRARALKPKIFTTHIHLQDPSLPDGIFRGVADLGRAKLLGPDFQVVHGVQMTDEELVMLRDNSCVVCSTVLGEFPYPKASIHAKAREMGIPAGIGQDVSIALTHDYFEVVRAAFWNMYRLDEYAKLAENYNSTMVMDFATRLGASAALYPDDRGTVTVGKYADLVLLRTDRVGFAPFGTLADRVVNFAKASDIDSVWVRGKAKKRHGQLLNVDWPKLSASVYAAGTRIRRDAETIKLV